VEGSCECDDEPLGSTICWEVLEWLARVVLHRLSYGENCPKKIRVKVAEEVMKNVDGRTDSCPAGGIKCIQLGGDFFEHKYNNFDLLVFISFFTPVRELYCRATYEMKTWMS
jgi:hypothetical protein